jgi:hypothetical protein
VSSPSPSSPGHRTDGGRAVYSAERVGQCFVTYKDQYPELMAQVQALMTERYNEGIQVRTLSPCSCVELQLTWKVGSAAGNS